MNSFDVFDTLLARRYITSDPIWQHIETEFSLPNFMHKRKAADTGSRSLYEIYDALVAQGDIPVELRNRLIQREIELEISIAIPVQKNLDRVQHGDILISDMYLPASAILQLVRSVGLDKQVTLYQSNGDKSNGSVWPKFKTIKPGFHLGDNHRSDYVSPTNAGINGEWFNPGLCNIALLAREIRLKNNFQDSRYFDLANNINLPLLFILCELLNRHTDKNIVFLGRDSQQIHRLYNAYYGVSYYLPFSRMVAYNQPADALSYLKTHAPESALFFDLSSTGGTWEKLQGNIDITVAVYSDETYYTPNRPELPAGFRWITKNSEIGATNLMLEVMNCGDHGHLNRIDVQDGKLMQAHFGEPELPVSLINAIHKPVKDAVQLSTIYKDGIRAELQAMSDDRLIKNLGILSQVICQRYDLLTEMKEFLEKETTYLEQFTK
jgi:hypothetical protein